MALSPRSLYPECWHYRYAPPCSAFWPKHCCAYFGLFLPNHGCFYMNIVKHIAEYSFKRHIEDWSVWKDILQFPPASSTAPFSLFCISLRFKKYCLCKTFYLKQNFMNDNWSRHFFLKLGSTIPLKYVVTDTQLLSWGFSYFLFIWLCVPAWICN